MYRIYDLVRLFCDFIQKSGCIKISYYLLQIKNYKIYFSHLILKGRYSIARFECG